MDELDCPLEECFGARMASALINEANIRRIPLNTMFSIVFVLLACFMSGKKHIILYIYPISLFTDKLRASYIQVLLSRINHM